MTLLNVKIYLQLIIVQVWSCLNKSILVDILVLKSWFEDFRIVVILFWIRIWQLVTSNHKINIWINLHFEHWSLKCEMIVAAVEWAWAWHQPGGHDINLGLNQLIWDLDQVQVQLQAFQAFSNKPRSINNLLVYASLATTEVTDANPFVSLATKWDDTIIRCLQFQSMVQLKYLIKRQKIVEVITTQKVLFDSL